MKVSVIIPTFNEEKDIEKCLRSLEKQVYKDFEVIVVDDGSTDKTSEVVQNLRSIDLQILKQEHLGPGVARNLGAKKAKGEILVFVDSDMTFDEYFLINLIKPILEGDCIGTFSKEEYVLNKENVWSKCWNVNKDLPVGRMHSKDYPDTQPVFRAILKKEFERVGGFSPIGYIDDYTLAEKLGVLAKKAEKAVFYHKNPENLGEVFRQARWIGKSEYKRRKIKNENLMRILAIIRYSLPLSFFSGMLLSLKKSFWQFLLFKIVYDFGVEVSLIRSFFGEQKYR